MSETASGNKNLNALKNIKVKNIGDREEPVCKNLTILCGTPGLAAAEGFTASLFYVHKTTFHGISPKNNM